MAVEFERNLAGPFRGVRLGSCTVWRGIRYAHAPRFDLPLAVELPLGPVECDRFGVASAQPRVMGGKASAADDALYLNIWSPAVDGARRPVLVWIHGGAFQVGSGAVFDGAWFAARGDIVVVTINYRLGVLGFGDFGALGAPRNLGLRDQVTALEWVRDHIELFGGDPQQVTIAGSSAGSSAVSLLMIASLQRRPFQRAIVQSGALNLCHDADLAARLGSRYRELLDIGDSLAALRAVPVQRLLDAQAQVASENPGTMPALPVFDGELLPSSPKAATEKAPLAIPLLAGWNRDEARFFEWFGPRDQPQFTRAGIASKITAQFGSAAAQAILEFYADTKAGNRDLATDTVFARSTLNFAERHAAQGQPTWVYRFDLGGLLMGAAHGVELAFLWPFSGLVGILLRGGFLVGGRRRLAERMRRHWLAFIRDGAPLPDWPRYESPTRNVKVLDRCDRIIQDPEKDRRRVWSGRDVL